MTDLAALARALAPLLAAELAPLLAPGRAPRPARLRDDLLPLFEAIWSKGGDATWTVRELVETHIVDPEAAQQIGRDLRAQLRRDEPVGPFKLLNHGRERDGSTWQLQRM